MTETRNFACPSPLINIPVGAQHVEDADEEVRAPLRVLVAKC